MFISYKWPFILFLEVKWPFKWPWQHPADLGWLFTLYKSTAFLLGLKEAPDVCIPF